MKPVINYSTDQTLPVIIHKREGQFTSDFGIVSLAKSVDLLLEKGRNQKHNLFFFYCISVSQWNIVFCFEALYLLTQSENEQLRFSELSVKTMERE